MLTRMVGAHREPCRECRTWQYPLDWFGPGRVNVLYRCACGNRWHQGLRFVNHDCDPECQSRCSSPGGPRCLRGGLCTCGSGRWVRRCCYP